MDNLAHGSGLRVYIIVSVIFLFIIGLSFSVMIDMSTKLSMIHESIEKQAMKDCQCPEKKDDSILRCEEVTDLDGNGTNRFLCNVYEVQHDVQ